MKKLIIIYNLVKCSTELSFFNTVIDAKISTPNVDSNHSMNNLNDLGVIYDIKYLKSLSKEKIWSIVICSILYFGKLKIAAYCLSNFMRNSSFKNLFHWTLSMTQKQLIQFSVENIFWKKNIQMFALRSESCSHFQSIQILLREASQS